MAAVRGRSLRSVKRRARHESGEESVIVDFTRAASKNLREILANICRPAGISDGRKLGHLNNFPKLLCHYGPDVDWGLTSEEIIKCVRVSLLSERKEIRAAGLRVFRYFLKDAATMELLLRLKVDFLIARCLDIAQSNDGERVQALRLIRKMVYVSPSLFPRSLVNTLVSVGNEGSQERDRLLRASLCVLCELAIHNPSVVSRCGGVSTILNHVLDCHLSRINESLMATVLHLINQPQTRCYVRAIELQQMLAPFTDFHYRHNADTPDSHINDARETTLLSSKMAIATIFRSWPGVVVLCKPDGSGVESLLGVLCIPNNEVRQGIMDILFDIFRLPIPIWTEDFTVALKSSDPSTFQDSWQLSQGFVVEEAKSVLPSRMSSRTNLIENYLGLVLSAFLNAGLLESLVEVIRSSDNHNSVRATVLLGELLHMANRLLPHECGQHSHCLPSLVNLAASFDVSAQERQRASTAVMCLNRLHELKKRGPVPHSLYLDQLMRHGHRLPAHSSSRMAQVSREKLAQYLNKDTDETLQQAMKDTQVLVTKENLSWDWDLVAVVLKLSTGGPRWLDDAANARFVRRLIYFYRPKNLLYSGLTLDSRLVEPRKLTIVGCQLMEFLLDCQEEGHRFVEEVIREVVECLCEVYDGKDDGLFSDQSLQTTVCQDFFLLIGRLSRLQAGEKVLEASGVYQCFMSICGLKGCDLLRKLIIACLDYSKDGLARVVLSKALTAPAESSRLYTTSFLRVLLRARVPFFNQWGVEFLVTQLYDKSKTVAMEAIDILDEACEEEANLHALVDMRPSLLHLGDKGAMLLIRFLSISKGFTFLSEVNYTANVLDKWYKSFNKKYVHLVEDELNEALTNYQKPKDGSNFNRRNMHHRPLLLMKNDVYVPVHLYGELVQHKAGAQLVEKQDHVSEFCQRIRYHDLSSPEQVLELKAALWCLGHIGTSPWGQSLLDQEQIIPEIIRLAEDCPVLSVRGTCLYVLGLVAKTRQGCDILREHGWESVRHGRDDPWPVVDNRDHVFDDVNSEIPSSASDLSGRDLFDQGSMGDLNVDSGPQSLFYVENGSKYGQSPTSTFFLDINEKGEHALARINELDSSNAKSKTLPRGGDSREKDSPKFGTGLKRVKTMPVFKRSGISPERKLRSNSDIKLQYFPSFRREERIRSPSPGAYYAGSLDRKPRKSDELEESEDMRGSRNSISDSKLHGKPRSTSFKHRSDSDESTGSARAGGKSRSESFNTDTTTSGVSSMGSSPHAETCSLSTISSSQTGRTSSQPIDVTPQKSATLPRAVTAHNLPPSPNPGARRSMLSPPGTDLGVSYTSTRDAAGYATLRSLKRHRSLSRGMEYAESLNLTIRPERSSVDSYFPAFKPGRLFRESSYTSLDGSDSVLYESLASPLRPVGLSAVYTKGVAQGNFIGLTLPIHPEMIFRVEDDSYKGPSSPPPPVPDSVRSFFSDLHDPVHLSESLPSALGDHSPPPLVTKLPLTASGFENHERERCMACMVKPPEEEKLQAESTVELEEDNDNGEASLLVPPRSRSSSRTKPDSTDATPNSVSSYTSTDSGSGNRRLSVDTPAGKAMVRAEIMKLIINLSSSVATKAQETGLLSLKEKLPNAFDDTCLYCEVAHLLSEYTFRLPARRFIQELFQDTAFSEVYEEARDLLGMTDTAVHETVRRETEA
ncbi:PREDICTED: rapamycin-insensitive companion of mTOR-like [Branchiostoma belcheri]|uniref:Rapamycin-insensitive companion of mTOR-like n=1 Tax=Branchiostoma belcheri TaxID=7741 RepID=A0A6P4XV64_BRABE|nr:PREDICTED: rapamycin-insensitive companion of mTOR-like [Branchiostoma belcheri]